MQSTSFGAKMPTLYSYQNSWQVGPIGISEQDLAKFFFFFSLQMIFPFVSWTFEYAIYNFSSKNAKRVFRSKFLASKTTRLFLSDFNRVFFFSCKIFFHWFLQPLDMASINFSARTLTLYSGKKKFPAGPVGIFELNLTDFFFLTKYFHISFL